ncbi:hypothetical protein ACJJID_05195 [Microbulbifer sp. CnH-101-G]|uniref:hypothetical protein n=1 Tax=Microbulbifer sp. CnH-101-G TaxID=3243393 RepID=UPI0040390844
MNKFSNLVLLLVHFGLGVLFVVILISSNGLFEHVQKASMFLARIFGDASQHFMGPYHIFLFCLGGLTGYIWSKNAYILAFFQVFPSFLVFGVFNFSDSPFYLKLLFGLGLVMASIFGAYVGRVLRRKKTGRNA